MRVTVTGASGLIGSALVAELREQGAVGHGPLARPLARARGRRSGVEAVGWDPLAEPAPVAGARRQGTRSCTSPGRTSPSAGAHRPSARFARAVSPAPAT